MNLILYTAKIFLIYFNDESKLKSIQNLKKLLKDDGILISGHSELSFFARNGFDRIDIAGAFALKKSKQISKPTFSFKNDIILKSYENKIKFNRVGIKIQADNQPINKENHLDMKMIFDSEFAKMLANEEKFDESENYCLLFMSKEQANYELFYILGLINSCKNNIDKAIEFYNKAIYLNPNHYESLFNLSLIFESTGQIEKSEIFRQRAIRNFKHE